MRGGNNYKIILVICCLFFGVTIMAQKKLIDAPKIAPALLIKDLYTQDNHHLHENELIPIHS